MPDQPDLRTKLIEAMQRAADKWMVEGGIENRLCPFLVDVLLALPGIAIVQLPQPESTTTDIDGDGLKTAQFPHDITAWGGEYPGVMDCDADMSIEVARSLAASLLAAANFAEAGVAEEQTNA